MNNYTVSSFDQEKGRIALYDKKNKVMVIIDIASVSLHPVPGRTRKTSDTQGQTPKDDRQLSPMDEGLWNPIPGSEGDMLVVPDNNGGVKP